MKTLFIGLLAAAAWGATVYFTPKALTELKALPSASSQTVLLVKSGALLSVKSTMTDAAETEWYLVKVTEGGAEGFAPVSALEVLGGDKAAELILRSGTAENEEKKRRLGEVKNHPDWTMRIKKAVRGGAICLKMTEEQLIASWEKPYLRNSGFILGFGEVKILFYRQANPIAVVMKSGEIVGWSEKE
jgi:hypothetical protein